MGVHSFWDVVGPTARPVRLESLQDRKMAVDASIWIYQFLKAVRDQEGNALKHSHIVGFFRRICKLLYFGIKPVFVFDGGVPALKQDTIRQRKERRQGKRDSAAVTARKLLAIQLQKQQEASEKDFSSKTTTKRDDETSADLFRPQDEWHLPQIPGFKYDVDDQRVISAGNYEEVVNSMDDELEGIDLDSINPSSPEFDELPKSTQYMIISKLRLRSRLRMGYTKEQLEQLFPNSMDFSKFQIDMVRRRNFFTQKLMNVTGIHDGGASRLDQEVVNRISGQLHKEYKLIKTDKGWALGLGELDGSESDKAIVLDDKDVETLKSFGHKVTTASAQENDVENNEDEENEEDFEWEDVDVKPQNNKSIEDFSLNAARLPQLSRESSTAGGKSFLDTRPSQTTPLKKSHGPINVIEIDEEENDDDYRKEIEDMELMEVLQKSNLEERLRRAADESAKIRVREVNTAAEKAEGNDDDDDDNYLKQIEEIETMEAIQRSRMEEQARQERAKQTREKNNTWKEAMESNARKLSVNKPPLPQEQSPPPVSTTTGASMNKNLPTESEQNLNFIVGKIPDFDLSGGSSFLFQDTNVTAKGSETKKEDKDKKPPAEMPSWFQNGSGQTANPFTSSNFVHDKEISGSNTNDTAADGLQRVTGLEDGKEHENLEESEQDDEVHEISGFHKAIDGTTDEEEQANGSFTNSQQLESQGSYKAPLVFDYDFSEDDEENIAENMKKEEQEFSTFKNVLNNRVVESAFMEDELYEQQTKDKRDSDEVTVDMITDVQDLLSRFGVPYITAPMEAEAQCATLLRDHLVEGVITDDSDVFLFGGNKVYKNMFSERNYVEYYDAESIYKNLGLDRNRMIDLAQLLGSDYTNGIKGMGPVSGMEVIAEFGSLKEFREWHNEGQFDKKKQEQESKFQKELRKRLVKNEVILDENFPSETVKNAYLNPEVDNDKTEFVWGTPDLDMLRSFFRRKVGWPQEKTDEVLVPLIRDMNKRKKSKQSTITEFFPREYIQGQRNLNLGKRLSTASGKLKKRKLR
ncbi:DNA repair protein rad2 [Zygosaccharomyces mellis]|uniref:DNA repair protein rad2 n=1 Tax=Zygosaccharomyces mellis TaxID=42258 RepID=A0A4C2E082_9SACH|nr:DNA repair protein rad2 [Zygosaccharomyces mellis]